MASRNKKGKIHGIFKNEFHISFFHKPSMEETDIYYYMILDDIIFIKMRLYGNIVLIIEELYPLTSSYIAPEYEKLFNILKNQTVVTVVVSLIGNTSAFRQTCLGHDTPIIEEERFVDYPQIFYNKYKNYCGNNASMYGFFLLALKDETFDVIDKIPVKKEKEIIKEEQLDIKDDESVDGPIDDAKPEEPENKELIKLRDFLLEHYKSSIDYINGELIITSTSGIEIRCRYYDGLDGVYVTSLTESPSTTFIGIIDLFNTLREFSDKTGIVVYILNISNNSREYEFLDSEWIRVINGVSVSKLPMWNYALASFRSK